MAATVLIVEDDREIRELLRRYLERANLVVQTTGSGAQAIAYVESGGIDLAVLDLGLPDVDGLEVLRAARADGRAIPVWSSPPATPPMTGSKVFSRAPTIM